MNGLRRSKVFKDLTGLSVSGFQAEGQESQFVQWVAWCF